MEKNQIEYRTADLLAAATVEENQPLLVTGYAAVFDVPAVVYHDPMNIDYKEVIDKGAFTGCDFSNCVFRYNHDDSYLALATVHNNTLSLIVDERGLKVNAELADTTAGRDIYELIRRGDIDKMSYAFRIKDEYYDEKTYTRHITKIAAVVDVSAVDQPAYAETSLEISKRSRDAVEQENKRKKDLETIKILAML